MVLGRHSYTKSEPRAFRLSRELSPSGQLSGAEGGCPGQGAFSLYGVASSSLARVIAEMALGQPT